MTRVTRECYLRTCGNCSDSISREHYVPRSILDEMGMVVVSGWEHSDQAVGPGSLTARVLCSYHNRLLSPLDLQIVAVFRGATGRSSGVTSGGRDVERALLKIALGLNAARRLPDRSGTPTVWDVEPSLLPWLLRGEHPGGGAGLFATPGWTPYRTTVGVRAVAHTSGQRLTAVRFGFGGADILLSLDADNSPMMDGVLMQRPERIGGAVLNWENDTVALEPVE